VSLKEQEMKMTLDKLNPDSAINLSEEALQQLKQQLLQNKTQVEQQQLVIKNLHHDKETLLAKRTELESKLSTLESEYEELLEKAIVDEETAMERNADLTDKIMFIPPPPNKLTHTIFKKKNKYRSSWKIHMLPRRKHNNKKFKIYDKNWIEKMKNTKLWIVLWWNSAYQMKNFR
jgi:hypothetical protein